MIARLSAQRDASPLHSTDRFCPTVQHRRRLATGVAVLALASLAPPVMAQETVLDPVLVQGTAREGQTDRSIVAKQARVGSKTDAPLIDVPASVSVVTAKEFQQRGAQNVQDVLSYTAGVSVNEFGSDSRYDYFRIRGFDGTTLGTYRDGLSSRIPAWYTAQRIEPYGQERIEVLKGSTSSLFGLNSPGGMINAVTKQPQDEFHAELYTTFGDGHIETGTDFGGPIDADGVYTYRITAKWQNADLGADYTNDDRLYIAPALTISPDAGTSLTILTDFSKRDSSTARGIPQGSPRNVSMSMLEP
jgi:iron complex outermembrane recepter protein